jgi:hypothetical protein
MANSIPVLSKGLWHLSFLRMTDNIARKVNEEKWFDYKKKLAYERAERAVSRIRSSLQ